MDVRTRSGDGGSSLEAMAAGARLARGLGTAAERRGQGRVPPSRPGLKVSVSLPRSSLPFLVHDLPPALPAIGAATVSRVSGSGPGLGAGRGGCPRL